MVGRTVGGRGGGGGGFERFLISRAEHASVHLPSPTRQPAVPTRGRAPQGTRTTPSRSTSTASSSRPLAKRCSPAPVREEAWTQDGERWGGEVCSVVLGCIYRCIFIQCRILHSEPSPPNLPGRFSRDGSRRSTQVLAPLVPHHFPDASPYFPYCAGARRVHLVRGEGRDLSG